MSHVKIVYDADKGVLVPENGENSPAPKKICYIDDSRTSAYVTGKMLKQTGYDVSHFADAETALDSILVEDYDLIITDLYVTDEGGVNGDDLVHLLRNSGHPVKSILPIIVVTGTGDKSVHAQVLSAGANLVLIKPLDGKVLDDAIQQLLTVGEVPEKVIFPPDYVEPPEKSSTEKLSTRPAEGKHSSVSEKNINDNSEHDLSTEQTLRALKALGAKPVDREQDDVFSFFEQSGHSDRENDILPGLPLVTGNDKRRTDEIDPAMFEAFDNGDAGAEKVPTLTNAVARKRDGEAHSVKTSDISLELTQENTWTDEPLADKASSPEKNKDLPDLPVAQPEEVDFSASSSGFMTDEIAMDSVSVSEDEPNKRIEEMYAELERYEKPTEKKRKSSHAVGSSVSSEAVEPPSEDTLNESPVPEQAVENSLLGLLDQLDEPAGTSKGAHQAIGQRRKKREFHKNRIGVLSTVGFMLTLFLGLILFFNGTTQVEVIEAEAGDIHDSISVPGTIVSEQTVNVTSYFPGQIISVKVKEGDRVSKKDVLAELDGREIGSMVKRAQANLMSIKEEVALSHKTLERLQKALDMGAVPRQMVEDAEASWKSFSAKQNVAEEELSSARLQKERLKIRAPFEGIVTTLKAQPGQWLSPPEPLLKLVNLSQREIELKVDAVDVNRLKVGQKVLIGMTGDASKGWQEKILRIASTTDTRDAMNTISVYVSLTNKASNLRIGQQIDAEIRLASSENTVKIPFSALQEYNNRPSVAIVLNSRVHYIPVTTGIEDVSHIEITSGLEAGQNIIKLEGLRLDEGDSVEIQTE